MGMSASSGILSDGTASIDSDSYGLPMNAESPTPKIDNASPDAT